jgi:hypothetical protein
LRKCARTSANTAQTLRKHCTNTAQTLRKHCTNMRKHAQTCTKHAQTCAKMYKTCAKMRKNVQTFKWTQKDTCFTCCGTHFSQCGNSTYLLPSSAAGRFPKNRTANRPCRVRQVAMMIDCTFHLTRPPPIPVVFPAVAVKELRQNELPRAILHRDVPQPLENICVLKDWGFQWGIWGILTTGVLINWGIWGMLNGQARWAVLPSIRRDRRSAAGRKRGQLDLHLLLDFCLQMITVPGAGQPYFSCALPTPFRLFQLKQQTKQATSCNKLIKHGYSYMR